MAKKQGNENNLKPVRTNEEARERGRKGGLASAEARRNKRTMRETAKMLMQMEVVGERNQQNLENFGIAKEDRTYSTAVVVRLMQKALVEGDIAASRLLGELSGELAYGGSVPIEDNIIEATLVKANINLPDNGRDRVNRENLIAPQAGPQTTFMTSSADIVVYGGAAGGGKTYALLMEPLRHKDVKGFNGIVFRHNYVQITSPGGLWDSSQILYGQVEGAESHKTPRFHWSFTDKAKLDFAHIGCEDDLNSWQGSQICYIAFDELTHFSKHQFLYMLSRNRSICGVRPYVRATCNPDADSWVADLIAWWIDEETGYPIPERSGVIKYMVVLNDVIYMADTKEELVAEHKVDAESIKSFTFIASKLDDNKILMEADPGYKANLMALAEIDTERLLNGNWKIKASAGRFFKKSQIPAQGFLKEIPNDIKFWCRAWDVAATSEDEDGEADYTAGVLIGMRENGRFIIADVINKQVEAAEVERLILSTAQVDASRFGVFKYEVHIPQDPGAAGKIIAKKWVSMLAGFNVKTDTITGTKELRATPLAAQWQNGNIDILIAPWNEMYLNQMESFPESKHDDMVDASSDAFVELTTNTFDLSGLI